MNKNKKVALIWHNHDLRLHDNALYSQANQYDELLIIYTRFESTQRGQAYHIHSLSDVRKSFLNQTLSDLNTQLNHLGQSLYVFENVKPLTVISLIKQCGISDVYVSYTADYDVSEFRNSVADQLGDVKWHECVTETLFDCMPLETLPTTFTPFRKKIEADSDLSSLLEYVKEHSVPTVLPPQPIILKNQQFTTINAHQKNNFVGGETEALRHMTGYFESTAPSSYKETRNDLDDWCSSTKFSPWLASGALSVKRLINSVRKYEQDVIKNESTYWIIFELLWREYFKWYAFEHRYKLFSINGLLNKKVNRCFYPERFERWKNGSTPYPIVNACMNQLRKTGYMSNRGRQIVASCFIHELNMDWRFGATYFEQHLLDYDVASNWGNWQYLAGVGADPRGSRWFNLEKQTQTYDPDGVFIKKWNGDVGVEHLDSVDAVDWPI